MDKLIKETLEKDIGIFYKRSPEPFGHNVFLFYIKYKGFYLKTKISIRDVGIFIKEHYKIKENNFLDDIGIKVSRAPYTKVNKTSNLFTICDGNEGEWVIGLVITEIKKIIREYKLSEILDE